jgi:hypothetical protein
MLPVSREDCLTAIFSGHYAGQALALADDALQSRAWAGRRTSNTSRMKNAAPPRDLRQEGFPIGLEAKACFVKADRRAVSMLARLKAGIEAARPCPLIDVDRDAGAFANHADTDIAKIDVPGLTVRIVGASASEGGHAPMIPLICIGRKPLGFGDGNQSATTDAPFIGSAPVMMLIIY